MTFLCNGKSAFVNSEKIEEMAEHLAPFLHSLQKLNTSTTEQPSPSVIKTMMATMLSDDDNTDDFFEELVKVGGAMYLLGIHYAIVKTLLSNPDKFAERTVGTSKEVADLKSAPTVQSIKQYLTRLCVGETFTTTTPVPFTRVKKNLALLLESDDDEDDDEEPANEIPSTSTKRKTSTSTPSQPKIKKDKEPEIETAKKKKSKKSKKQDNTSDDPPKKKKKMTSQNHQKYHVVMHAKTKTKKFKMPKKCTYIVPVQIISNS